eukprot:TRINITY_DN9796_c0_g1_i7.p2 TRINITY_DN9796_c0_g1~~TRINITY_DN9796_c0_g1_i7.p2  ORF type:complete len:356 (+),score=100.07 TRINITY_DN9796_c0_g1_i7:1080-2147(+)
MRPRLAQARRVFKSPYATFCSRCMSLCTPMDLLRCGHFLCFHCQASDFPCSLCSSKDKYDPVKLSCSCIMPKKYILEHILKQTNGQLFRAEGDFDILLYPFCFCMKELSETDMQVLFKKKIYERVKALKQEIVKSRSQRIYNLINEQSYATKSTIVIPCREEDIINKKDIIMTLESNKSIKAVCIKKGNVTENIVQVLINLVGRFPSLAEIAFRDVAIAKPSLQLIEAALSKAKVQKFSIKNARFDSQPDLEHVGAIISQVKPQSVVLKSIGMNDYGLLYIADYIANAEGLRDLDLSYNKLTRAGLKCIEDSLKDNGSLKLLKLKQEDAEHAYYEFIKGLKSTIKGIEIEAFCTK